MNSSARASGSSSDELRVGRGSPSQLVARRGRLERARNREGDRTRWWRDARRRRMLAFADAAVGAAIGIALSATGEILLTNAIIGAITGIFAAKLIGLYDADHQAVRHTTLDESSRLWAWVASLVVLSNLFIGERATGWHVAAVAVGGFAAIVVARSLARYVWRRTTPAERTLVIGSGQPARIISRKIELFDDMNLRLERVEPPEFLADLSADDEQSPVDPRMHRIDRIVLAWSDADPRTIERLTDICRDWQIKLSVVSPFRGKARPALKLSQVAELPVLEYNTWDVPRSTLALKRGIDIIIAGAGLVVLAPVFLVTAVAIKLADRGPVFFRQRRAGKGGTPFTMFKFRSMCEDAEQRLPGLVDLDALEAPAFKLPKDPRVTGVGRFIRRLSIDELPQLINILNGQMSLVGPRPEELPIVDRYLPEHQFRLSVKPGLSGPMQVFGRGDLTFEERLAVESDYVENLSIGRDLRLLVQTIPAAFRGTGAY